MLSAMALQDEAQAALSGMILSASGWRGIFAASGGEEDCAAEIGAGHGVIAAGAAAAFASYLLELGGESPLVLLGSDTRPTSKTIAEIMVPALLASGCRVRYAGFVAAPEIMAWARSGGKADAGENRAFVYISASHNPIGHNGFKFGLADGGVLPAQKAEALAGKFRALLRDPGKAARIGRLAGGADPLAAGAVFSGEPGAKKEALRAYSDFAAEVAWAGGGRAKGAFERGIARRPLGVCCDFNGSARSASIDRDFLQALGMRFEAINARPGGIAHRIVPEGESLEPCRAFLEELHSRDPAFVMGYVPDCDGDRGNLVVWDGALGKARALEAQEVFAIACVAELAHLAWEADCAKLPKAAVAANDPTSLRIERIAEAFGASVFRAEVGEANVVGLARRLREQGYAVRVLGEGSAGGNITHPSAARDPIHTALALAKLLAIRAEGEKRGLFELWLCASGQAPRFRRDFCISDIVASLPPFETTGAYSPEALLKIKSADHGALKSRYQAVFLREWETRKSELKKRYGIYGWEAMAYNGMEERRGISDFGAAGRGGLKIRFLDSGGRAVASVWMRGSATEPVFRIMADSEAGPGEGSPPAAERDLIEWQRKMVIEADAAPGR